MLISLLVLYCRVAGSIRVAYWSLVLASATITFSITQGYEIFRSLPCLVWNCSASRHLSVSIACSLPVTIQPQRMFIYAVHLQWLCSRHACMTSIGCNTLDTLKLNWVRDGQSEAFMASGPTRASLSVSQEVFKRTGICMG